MRLKEITIITGMLACSTFAFAQEKKHQFIDVAGIDKKINPADDFYGYMNANWIKNNEIPATKSAWGGFDIADYNIRKNLKTILNGLLQGQYKDGTDEQKLKLFYKSGMDSAAIEKAGWQPVKADLAEIQNITTLDQLQAVSAKQHVTSLGDLPWFNEGDLPDPIRNDEEILFFNQGGTALPEKSYYTSNDSNSVKVRAGYVHLITTLFTLTGEDKATAAVKADSILALEARLAKAQRTPEENRNLVRLMNFYTKDKLAKDFPAINWPLFLQQLGAAPNRIVVAQPEFFKNLNAELTATSLETWKDYLRAKYLIGAAPYLSKAFTAASFDFYGKVLLGQKQPKPRWEKMVANTDGNLGDLLGRIYIRDYFSPKAKARIDTLINNLLLAYNERITKIDWMSDATKVKARLKLDSLLKKIAYPDKWKDYSAVTITGDFYANIKALGAFNYHDAMNRVGKPVNHTLWTMTPQTVNAYYNPLNNEIVFPAGILVYPFFDPNADDAVNYGAIGAVIGHEMSHGFDDQGSQFDASGKFKNWWTKEDNKKFADKGAMLASQYSQYVAVDTLHVNGRLTLGENIGDLCGITVAYEAFQKTQQAKDSKSIDGYTPNQRFFLSFAQVWREKIRPEYQRQLAQTNPHAPSVFRVFGPLSNFTPFYTAFNVQPGNKMWRDEKDRIVIW